MKDSRGERLINYIIIIVFTIFSVTPILQIIILSLGPEQYGDTGWFHLENYLKAWEQGHFSHYMRNSVIISILVVSVSLVLSLATGYVLGILKPPGEKIIFFLFLIGIMVPTEAIIIPLYFDFREIGLTDTIWAIALPQIAQSLAFGTFWMRSFFRGVNPSIVEAARIDGASDVRILSSVLVPISLPAIITQVVLTFMWTWNDFLIPLIMSPTGTVRTAPLGLAFFQGQYTQGSTLLAGGAVLVALPVVILYFILQRYFIAGMTDGAIKG